MNGSATSSTVLADGGGDALATARLLGHHANGSSHSVASNPPNGPSINGPGSLRASTSNGLLSSLHSAHNGGDKRAAAQISRAYKQASQFFLQRRFPESLFTVQPLITRKSPEGAAPTDPGEPSIPAPIATASRAARVKVWSLYITLLNSVVELGPEDGKNQFGNVQWRVMERKVRDGSIWEDVVQNGYGGREGNVDPDVVSNLATLLLSQSPTQTITQQRLESYLAASVHPNLDVSAHFDQHGTPTSPAATKPPPSPYAGPRSGTDTPRDLNSRIKILELYALHVLPRNGEWSYAREFVQLSAVLDDDAREEFLQTLGVLEDEQRLAGVRERELQARAEAEEHDRQRAEKQRMQDTWERSSQASSARRPTSSAGGGGGSSRPLHRAGSEASSAAIPRRTDSERDYGIEDGPALHHPPPPDKAPGPSSLKGSRSVPRDPDKGKPSTRLGPRRTARRGPPPPAGGLVQRGAQLMAQLQQWVGAMAAAATKSPGVLLRTLVFVLALLVALSRQGVRVRLSRGVARAWESLAGTVGMGVKVSYI